MEIIKAESAGFCFGVNNAVNKAFEARRQFGKDKKIYTYGPLIHNSSVIEKLREEGIYEIDSPDAAEPGSCVIIRAHGVPEADIEAFKKSGAEIIDATCPFVKKIQNLAREKHDEGRSIIIAGDRKHPEVIGINGWCGNSAVIVKDEEDAKSVPYAKVPYCVVSQTTNNIENYAKLKKFFTSVLDDVEIYDTICNATSHRQCETRRIASMVDLMVVIGGKNSSNTLKLYEISRELCENVILAESADEIDIAMVNKYKRVGVTAGASTPDWIIKEVLVKMSEVEQNENEAVETAETVAASANDESFSALLESEGGIATVKTGDIVKKPVIKIDSNKVYVDLGFKYEGTIALDEFAATPGAEPDVKVGDIVEAVVLRVSEKDGEATLSKRRVDYKRDMAEVQASFENKTPIQVTVVEALKGGVSAQHGTVRVFVPASQLSTRFVKDLTTFVGKELTVIVTSFEKGQKGRMRIAASARTILEAEKAAKDEAFWGSIAEGDVRTGIVKSFVPFGAFIELAPGYEGLVHITELSWKRVKNAADVLTLGQEVEVKVIALDREKNRISLTMRKPEDNPWYNAEELYQVGDIVDVKVARFVKYGVFVEIADGITGLVHISQISRKRIESAAECLEIGQVVSAKIVAADIPNKKISLSIREVQPYDPAPKAEEAAAEEAPKAEKKEKAPKAEKKAKTEKKAKEDEFRDDVVSSDTSIGDILGGLNFDFNSKE